MFIIFGWNHHTSKDHGPTLPMKCPNCGNEVFYHLLATRCWFTLFFIPVIPYESKHFLLCDICSHGYELEGDKVEEAKQLNQKTLAILEKAAEKDQCKAVLQEEEA